MAKTLLLTYSTVPDGMEEACVRWYSGTHIPDMTTITGVLSGRLYRLEGDGAQLVGRDGEITVARFLAVYELGDGDAAEIRTQIAQQMPNFRAAGRSFEGLKVISSSIVRPVAA